jgi:hypothetical protein
MWPSVSDTLIVKNFNDMGVCSEDDDDFSKVPALDINHALEELRWLPTGHGSNTLP